MERIDDLQRNGLKLIQDDDLFCFGTDAVLLADFTQVYQNDRIVEFGIGNGVVSILLSAKNGTAHMTGIEAQAASAALAKRNITLNKLGERIRIIPGDFRNAGELLNGEKFDAVVCNPPYEKCRSGKLNQAQAHQIARHEMLGTLEDMIKSAAGLLQTGGRCYFVYRPFRLAEMFYVMKKYKLEPKICRLVQPRAEKEPNLVLVKGVKDAAEGLQMPAPLILYDSSGKETQELCRIYHRGK